MAIAYVLVILVWGTTPLGIAWSTEGFSPAAAALLRMLLAVALGLPLLWVLGMRIPWHRQACLSYLASQPGVLFSMLCSYFASRYVASGLLSIMFGLAPLMSGLMMQWLPGGQRLTRWQWAGCATGVLGLVWIFSDALQGGNQLLGILLLLLAVFGFSASGILVQRVAAGVPPLPQSVAAVLLSVPGYALFWWLSGLPLVEAPSWRALGAVVYLAVMGSLVGFISYFYVLARLPASTVALVTLCTPVLAILAGYGLNQETLSPKLLTGALIILLGLVLYFRGSRAVSQVLVE